MAVGGQGAPTPTKKPRNPPVRPDDRAGPRPTGAPPRAPRTPPVSADTPGPHNVPTGLLAQKPIIEKPVPVLQKLGYFGGIQDFERRVGLVLNSFQKNYGYTPSPGLVLDVARAPIHEQEIDPLFSAFPKTATAARAGAALQQDKTTNPYDYFVTRPDGVMVQNNPLLQKMLAGTANQPDVVSPLEAHKQYPSVQMGMLPLPDLGSGVAKAMQTLDAAMASGDAKVTDQGVTILQFKKEADVAANAPGQAFGTKAVAFQRANRPIHDARQAVKTIRDAQAELNSEMGTSLPVTGVINQDWVVALQNWAKTGDYFRRVTKFQAQNAGFGNNVAAYQRAWQAKQDNVRKHGLWSHFLQAMPLQIFGHGFGGAFTGAGGIITHGASGSNWYDAVNTGLHGLTHSAGLTVDVLGGSVSQAKADAAAGDAFAQAVVPKAYYGKGESLDKARARAKKVLHENPSWLRVFYPDLEAHPKGVLGAVDAVSNIAVDLLLLRKPAFTGERVAAMDKAAALRSPYINWGSKWAFHDIENGNLGRAVSRLEGGQGAEQLVAHSAPMIRRGDMTLAEFRDHAAELYSHGRTEIQAAKGIRTAAGESFSSLRTRDLPAPGRPGLAFKNLKSAIRSMLDEADRGLRSSDYTGTDNAAGLLGFARARLNHVGGRGVHGFYDPRLPEMTHNYVLGLTKDAGLANKIESGLVVARARENIPAIQAIQRQLQDLRSERFPVGAKAPQDPFDAVLSVEAPSRFVFPAAGEREINNAWDSMLVGATKLNNGLNAAGRVISRVILSGLPIPGGESLFWKHAVGDTIRRYIGGGTGILSAGNIRAGSRLLDDAAKSDPAIERGVGVFLQRAKLGETRWALGKTGGQVDAKTFSTGKNLGDTRYMTGAGGKVRALLTDPALEAYQKSIAGDQWALVDLVLHDKNYQGMWKAAKAVDPSVTAEDYAGLLHARYQDLVDAASAQGIADPFGEAGKVLRANRGASADKALGKWLSENKIDLHVDDALVESKAGPFDRYTSWWVGNVIMSPNKWNRGRFAKNVLASQYKTLVEAGMKPGDAFDIASGVAEKQVAYHMLDFVNRLQIEQDLRWVSFFATKHRLYWKWVLGTFLRRPFSAAAAADISQHLNGRGGINFDLYGHKMELPASRLVWVPGKDYSEYSPPAVFLSSLATHGLDFQQAIQSVAGTGGNVLTRSDTAIRLGMRVAEMYSGHSPATYGAAVAGLDHRTAARVNRAMNEYQLTYFHEHGHYAPEADVVKHVLLGETGTEFWRSNLPLPVLFGGAVTQPNDQQKQLAQFMSLIDPKKRRAWLDKHPDASDHFGVYQNPKVFLHNRTFFHRYSTMIDTYRAARRQLFEQAQQSGYTPELAATKKKLDQGFHKAYDALLLQDAHETGKVDSEGQIAKPGSFGRLAAADPNLDPRHVLNAIFPKLKRTEWSKVYGDTQRALQKELNLLNDPKYAATYPDPAELKTRKQEIIQQLEVFRKYPTDALGRVQQQYQQKYVNPYWQTLDRKYTAIAAMPREKQDQAYADLRAWRDAQDKSVTLTGVKFPSPVEMAWATLDPATRTQRLAKLAGSNWDHLTDYEKALLGHPVKGNVSNGWQLLSQFYGDAKGKLPAGTNIKGGYKLTLAKYINQYYEPGFLHDYLFSREPAYRRLQQLSLPRDSKHAEAWQQLLSTAQAYDRAYGHSDNFSKSAVTVTWRRYVDSGLMPWIKSQPGFYKELQSYGPDLVYTLVSP